MCPRNGDHERGATSVCTEVRSCSHEATGTLLSASVRLGWDSRLRENTALEQGLRDKTLQHIRDRPNQPLEIAYMPCPKEAMCGIKWRLVALEAPARIARHIQEEPCRDTQTPSQVSGPRIDGNHQIEALYN